MTTVADPCADEFSGCLVIRIESYCHFDNKFRTSIGSGHLRIRDGSLSEGIQGEVSQDCCDYCLLAEEIVRKFNPTSGYIPRGGHIHYTWFKHEPEFTNCVPTQPLRLLNVLEERESKATMVSRFSVVLTQIYGS